MIDNKLVFLEGFVQINRYDLKNLPIFANFTIISSCQQKIRAEVIIFMEYMGLLGMGAEPAFSFGFISRIVLVMLAPPEDHSKIVF
jgi:hypothetical protein